MRSLTRIFAGRISDSQGCDFCSRGQRRLKSACAQAQAGLSLRWANMSESTFSHVAGRNSGDRIRDSLISSVCSENTSRVAEYLFSKEVKGEMHEERRHTTVL